MDDADRAQLMEERERDAAVKAALAKQSTKPLIINGRVLCMGCGQALSDARIEAHPAACRCVKCQTATEVR